MFAIYQKKKKVIVMNKEEIKCITKEQLNQLEWSDTHEYGTTLAYELIERIDNAIEYMEKSMNNPLKYEWGVLKHTLEILKGDNNE